MKSKEKKSEAYLIVNSCDLVISLYCDEVILREEDALLILDSVPEVDVDEKEKKSSS